ncbi:MAG TPA: ABC transporter permease [Terriglobia bacterium]|jgi:predicted permease
MTAFFRKLANLFSQSRKESELEEELQFHLDEETVENRDGGLSADEARLKARRDFGNDALVKEDARAAWTWPFIEQFLQDIRYAWRTMAANKTFSTLVVLSLALGIGANTAIFSFMDSILLRSLPVSDPASLAEVGWRTHSPQFHGTNRHDSSYINDNGEFINGVFAYPAFEIIRNSSSVFSSVFGFQGSGQLTVAYGGHGALAGGEYVSGEYFRALGVAPAAGRMLFPDDDRDGASPVAVAGFNWARNHFGDPAGLVGQSILIDNKPFTLVGIAPPQFFGVDPQVIPDVYLPMHSNLLLESDNFHPVAGWYADPNNDWINIMARLRPGVRASQAQAAIAPRFAEWQRTKENAGPPDDLPSLLVMDSGGGLDGLKRLYSKPLYILLSLVGLILAIACANIANLLLARAAARKREIAVRLSIGAGRLRVIRQLLTESLLLAGFGGALGVAFAVWGIRFLTMLLANGQEDFTLHAELNWHVLSVVALLSLLSGVVFGLAPAMRLARVDVFPALKKTRTGEVRGRAFGRLGLSRALIVLQITLTLVILIAAGLFLRTLSSLEAIQLGFNRDNVLTFSVNARQAGHNDPEIIDFYDNLRAQLAAIPGVQSAGLSWRSLIGDGTGSIPVQISGGPEPKDCCRILPAGTDFFSTMQIPILLGRAIEDTDRQGRPLVALVNEKFVKDNLAGQNPIGRHISMRFGPDHRDMEIVGVCGDTLYGSVKRAVPPTVFPAYAQGVWGPVQQMVYELRTAGNPLAYADTVRETVRRADNRIPIGRLTTQSARIDQTIGQEVTFSRLCTLFGLLALTIAAVGLYGSMSYNVARRTNEIGIRMALGAQRQRVVWMIVREVLLLAAIGLAISIPASLAGSRIVRSFLFGIQPNDPLALAGAVVTLVAAVLLAGYLPARNAARIDPMTALRHE